MMKIHNTLVAETIQKQKERIEKAESGQLYYLRQIYTIGSNTYILVDVCDENGKTRFQQRHPADVDPQEYRAVEGDELKLKIIDRGDSIFMDDGKNYADKAFIDQYVHVSDDPWLIDTETVSNDRKGKKFKIIGVGEEFTDSDMDQKHIDFLREKYKYCYVCILNVKS